MEKPLKMDDLGVYHDLSETSISLALLCFFCVSGEKKNTAPGSVKPSRSIDENDSDALIWVPSVKLIPVGP